MTATTPRPDLEDALAGLLRKYAVEPPGRWRFAAAGQASPEPADGIALVPGERLCVSDTWDLPQGTVPLLAWRYERRFVELRRLVAEETIAPLLMCRFARLTDGRRLPLPSILYREFDLLEWLSGSRIVGVYASMWKDGNATDVAANAIVRLADGVVASVEAGTTLPDGAAVHDRHELIARRGVASDRAVDTQVPQSSVYAWTAQGSAQYTDVDAELFGLEADRVALVRAAFDALRRPESVPDLLRQHYRLCQLVELAYESDRRQERLVFRAKRETGPIRAKHAPGGSGTWDAPPSSEGGGE